MHAPPPDAWVRLLAALQGAYYVLTGLWPLVSLSTFLVVTGPKVDLWLVQTVGVLVLVIGAALMVAAWEGRVPLAVWALGIGAAIGFLAVDVVFHLEGKIGTIYLADAVAEGLLLVAWGILAITRGRMRARRA